MKISDGTSLEDRGSTFHFQLSIRWTALWSRECVGFLKLWILNAPSGSPKETPRYAEVHVRHARLMTWEDNKKGGPRPPGFQCRLESRICLESHIDLGYLFVLHGIEKREEVKIMNHDWPFNKKIRYRTEDKKLLISQAEHLKDACFQNHLL